MPVRLSATEVKKSLKDLEHWKIEAESVSWLRREWRGRTFSETFAVMTEVAKVAEELNHHPDWCNSFCRLTIRLRTHDVDGISELDVEMAKRIDSIITRVESTKLG